MSECADCTGMRGRAKTYWIAPRRAVPLSGIINVDKPAGMTSHDVVDAVRCMAGQRKVGHAGTLDPMATGVLLICLGAGTRIAEYLVAGRKRYRATVVLGATTDTYDAEGVVTRSGGRADFSFQEVQAALAGFVGQIEQVPPMYSAVKVDGQPLHKLARRGQMVERAPRTVEIDEAHVIDWSPPSLIVELTCSPGTYVRSLAHDLGQRLGTGAYLAALVRLSSGRFTLEQAVSLARLEEAFRHEDGNSYLIPVDEALLDWPAMVVGAADAELIVHGQAIQGSPPQPPLETGEGEGRTCGWRAYSLEGDFLAVMAYDPAASLWWPKKVLHTASAPVEP